MKRLLITVFSVALMLASVSYSYGKDEAYDPYAGFDEALYMDMDIEDNLNSPRIGKEESKTVRKYMTAMASAFAKRGYIVDMTRDDEVLLVTILSDELFFPNDTLLSPKATAKLAPIIEKLKDPMMMKLVYAVHTDNTGSHTYNMNLSHARNSSIYDWLLDNINPDVIVIPYEMGDTDPIAPNDTRTGRRENRRVEFFLVPGPKMIDLARKGQLH